MQVLNNINLADKTTFRVGGVATNFYIPESIEDVCNLIKRLGDKEYYILSGGSNLLINDKKNFEHVIYCTEIDNDLINNGNGRFYIGASNKIQRVISFVNENGYGGFEELVGLPALFGGIVYMNAGIGGRVNELFSISTFICRVKCVERITGNVVWIEKNLCDFSYRSSCFKDNRYVILGAELQLFPQAKEVSKERIRIRKEYCKNNQKWGKGCFGSCFSKCDWRVMNIWYKTTKFGFNSIEVDSHNRNWIINKGKATFDDTLRLINRAILFHRVLRLDIETEVIIWE